MTAPPTEAAHRSGRRWDPAILAFGIPALAAATLDGTGAIAPIATALLLVLLFLLAMPRLAPGRPIGLPVALLAVVLPAVANPGAILPALLSGASGVGLLIWLANRPDSDTSGADWRAALRLPGGSLLISGAASIALGGSAGSPGLAGLLAVGALLLAAYVLAPSAGAGGRAPAPGAEPGDLATA